jgi:hypothetical protein
MKAGWNVKVLGNSLENILNTRRIATSLFSLYNENVFVTWFGCARIPTDGTRTSFLFHEFYVMKK